MVDDESLYRVNAFVYSFQDGKRKRALIEMALVYRTSYTIEAKTRPGEAQVVLKYILVPSASPPPFFFFVLFFLFYFFGIRWRNRTRSV